ncbi:DNA/RNA-binding domain E.t1.c1-type [Penicillium sp. DV-2018c]|nr:DNA/RNA-binding domain E.t1.c1-type [Penicillium sp. DV-2018c]
MGLQGCCAAASLPITSARPNPNGVIADDGTSGTHSSPGVRAISSSPRASVGHVGKSRRRNSVRISRETRRLSASASPSQHIKTGVSQYLSQYSAEPTVGTSVPRESEAHTAQGCVTSPDSQTPRPAPVAFHDQMAVESGNDQDMEMADTNVLAGEEKLPEMFKQPPTHPITEEQLVNEVRGIYRGLTMVEQKCIEIDREQARSNVKLSQVQWQMLVGLHRSLIFEHHDFFLASQHPSASPMVKDLPAKYGLPARLWRHGIHALLELQRRKLPESMEHMLSFNYLAYSMVTLLLESVPQFKETWIECLGDLARYRMAVEEVDQKEREFWAGVSRYWYGQDPRRSAESGRVQHHFAILSRPDILQQYFYFNKALISVRPFPDSMNNMIQLVTPLLRVPAHRLNLINSFVAAHGVLFLRAPVEEIVHRANAFLTLLRMEISRVGRHGQTGVQITSCNICSMFQYGSKAGVMERDWALQSRNPTAEEKSRAIQWASTAPPINTAAYTDLASQFAFQASSLAFHTLITMLSQPGDPNMVASVHISMAFIRCLTLNPAAIQRLEPLIPWSRLATYLTALYHPDTISAKIEDESFPVLEDAVYKQLPEDCMIRGQAWSRLYYPEGFFDDAPLEDDRPYIEPPSTAISRRHRCLWLGVRIASYSRWITYDQEYLFQPTQLAEDYAPIAESPTYLSGILHS